MLHHLLVATLGVGGLLAGWLAVQRLAGIAAARMPCDACVVEGCAGRGASDAPADCPDGPYAPAGMPIPEVEPDANDAEEMTS